MNPSSLALEGAGKDVETVTSLCILFIPEFHTKAGPLIAPNCPHRYEVLLTSRQLNKGRDRVP